MRKPNSLMNKKLLWGGLLLFIVGGAAAIYFLVLKKSQEHFKLIPKNTFVVVTADLKSLAEKANSKEWKNLFMTKKMEESAKDDAENAKFFKDVMSNPLSMGIDPFSDIYMFVEMPSGEDYSPKVGVAFAVRSSSDLEAVLMKIPEKNLRLKKEVVAKDGYKVFRLDNDALIAWRDKAGVFIAVNGEDASMKYAESIMKLDPKESLAENKHFRSFANEQHDMGAFLNYAALMNNPQVAKGMAMSGTMAYVDAFKEAIMEVNADFEKDKIAITTKYVNESKEAEKFNVLSDSKMSSGTLKTLTTKNPLAYFGFAIDAKKMLDWMEKDEFIGKGMNEVCMNMGLTKDELKNLLGGEFAATLNDFTMQTSTRQRYNWEATGPDGPQMEEYVDTSMMPEFSLSISIKDKAVLQKVLTKIGLPKDPAGYYAIREDGMNFYICETNSGITVTNGTEVASTLASKKELASAIGGKAAELAGKSNMAFYMNLTLSEYPAVLRDELKKGMGDDYAQFEKYFSMFKFTEAYGDQKNGNMNIMMTESNDNSLWRIIKASDEVAKASDEKRAKRNAEYEKMMQESMAMDSIASSIAAPVEAK